MVPSSHKKYVKDDSLRISRRGGGRGVEVSRRKKERKKLSEETKKFNSPLGFLYQRALTKIRKERKKETVKESV